MKLSASPLRWLWISLLIIVLDQLSKQIAEHMLPLRDPVTVFSWFDWYLTYNTGAAFSFLAGAGGWQRWFFTIVAIIISGVILQWLRKLPNEDRITAISLCLILGGAIGNVIDRLLFGHVIDFIQVWLGSYPYPAFNIADSSIFCGAVILVASSFITGNSEKQDEHDRTQ